ncbi:hypothetical protein LX36DRAFT_211470 [Colletotrichum falcatum]|nr:hypothetical protein LX36DRAFT_211470 [Colletotrichum falcatum]
MNCRNATRSGSGRTRHACRVPRGLVSYMLQARRPCGHEGTNLVSGGMANIWLVPRTRTTLSAERLPIRSVFFSFLCRGPNGPSLQSMFYIVEGLAARTRRNRVDNLIAGPWASWGSSWSLGASGTEEITKVETCPAAAWAANCIADAASSRHSYGRTRLLDSRPSGPMDFGLAFCVAKQKKTVNSGLLQPTNALHMMCHLMTVCYSSAMQLEGWANVSKGRTMWGSALLASLKRHADPSFLWAPRRLMTESMTTAGMELFKNTPGVLRS